MTATTLQFQLPPGVSKLHLPDGTIAIPNAAGIVTVASTYEAAVLNGGATLVPPSGVTANRPTTGLYQGFFYYDGTLNKPVWWNGSAWKDATGTTA